MYGGFYDSIWIILSTWNGRFDLFRIIILKIFLSSFKMLKLLISCYISFLYGCKTSFKYIPFSSCKWARALVALILWNISLYHKNCQIFSSSLWMWSPSQVDEIKSRSVSVSAHAFSLLNNEWKFDNDWLAEADLMKNIMISTWEEIITHKYWKVFSSNIVSKKATLSGRC